MGSRIGAEKSAATKAGVTIGEWLGKQAAGYLWCYCCRQWIETARFGIDKSRSTGRASACKSCVSHKTTASRYRVPVETARNLRAGTRRCDICGRQKPLEIDHSHSTGKRRGMLCGRCNKAIGLFKDSLDLLAKAAAYLEEHDGL